MLSYYSAPVSKFMFFRLAVSSSSKRARGASNFNSAILPAMSLIIERARKAHRYAGESLLRRGYIHCFCRDSRTSAPFGLLDCTRDSSLPSLSFLLLFGVLSISVRSSDYFFRAGLFSFAVEDYSVSSCDVRGTMKHDTGTVQRLRASTGERLTQRGNRGRGNPLRLRGGGKTIVRRHDDSSPKPRDGTTGRSLVTYSLDSMFIKLEVGLTDQRFLNFVF